MVVKMILVNRESICLYSKNFESGISTDPYLLSGFLSAISSFAKDISQDQIKAIIMGESKILYRLLDEKSDLTIVIIAAQAAGDQLLRDILDQLSTSFLDMFGLEEINLHSHQTDYFEPFENAVNNVVQTMTKVTVDEVIDESKVFPQERPEINLQNLSLPFLFKTLKKNLSKVIYSLFIGMRTIITGDPAMVKIIIDSLDIFSPHHTLTKIYWTEDVEKTNANLVGVPSSIASLFIDSIIIDLENKTVKGIKSNKYFDEIAKKVRKLKPAKITDFIMEKINFLINKTKDLLQLINAETSTKDELVNFTKNVDRDILEILEIHLIINHPKSIKRIKETCDKLRNVLFTFNIWGNF